MIIILISNCKPLLAGRENPPSPCRIQTTYLLAGRSPREASWPMISLAKPGVSAATELGLSVSVVADQTGRWVLTSNKVVSTFAVWYCCTLGTAYHIGPHTDAY